MAAAPVSKSEIDFTLEALRKENVRVDGRALSAYRRFGLRFGSAHGEVEVTLGPTRAMAVCTGEIVAPAPQRPNEGRIAFFVDFSPMASPSFELGRPSAQATSVANFIERLLKGSRAIDAEALCIIGGQKVWSIRVDVRALDDDGNLSDVCAIAALCSLLHFRKADIEVSGERAKAYTPAERVPVPLSIHHLPVPVTFALYAADGKGTAAEPAWILDPSRLEEAVMGGTLCVALNQYGELCGVHKPGGMAVDYALIEHCVTLATARAKEITARIQAELEADLTKRKMTLRNIHLQYTPDQLLTVQLPSTPSSVAPAVSAALAEEHVSVAAALLDEFKPPEIQDNKASANAEVPAAPVVQVSEVQEVQERTPRKSKRKHARARSAVMAATTQEEALVSMTPAPVVPASTPVCPPDPRRTLEPGGNLLLAEEVLAAAKRVVAAGGGGPRVVTGHELDLEKELEAVAAEAAELEEQLAAATADEIAAATEAQAALEASIETAGTNDSTSTPRRKKKRRKAVVAME